MKFLDVFQKKNKCICHGESTNLSQAKTRSRLKVECLCGEESICDRLREMGFCESSVIEKMSDSGSLICRVCDTKVILSKDLAKNIIVKNICPCDGHDKVGALKSVFLSQMTVGQRGTLAKLEFDESDRLEEMGLTQGEPIEIVRYAPLGDPIEIKIRGYSLSLRKQEANLIKVNLS